MGNAPGIPGIPGIKAGLISPQENAVSDDLMHVATERRQEIWRELTRVHLLSKEYSFRVVAVVRIDRAES